MQYDIKEAPTEIRYSYKFYYKAKTSFLERTLSDALDEDSFDLSILENSSQTDARLSGSFSEMSTPDVSALTSENSIIFQNNSSTDTLQTIINNTHNDHFHSKPKEFEAEVVSTINDNAWGKTTRTEATNGTNQSESKFKKTMSDKLFRNSSFLKRNPRKSLSRNSLTSYPSSQSLVSSSQKESFPDLETILSQKSKHQKENEEIPEAQQTTTDAKTMSTNLISSIDVEWLNRCNKINSIDGVSNRTEIGLNESQTRVLEQPKVFGISNINTSALANYERPQPIQEVGAKSMLSFDMSNMNLTAQNSMNQMVDDDEQIANSEDEADMNTSRHFRSIRTSFKRKHNEIDQDLSVKVPAKSNSNLTVNNNSKEIIEKSAPLAIKKTKSNIKQPNPKLTISNDKETKAKVVTRKSSRNANKPQTYKEIQVTELKSDNEDVEEDPFACDDSDKDPNFSDSHDNKSKKNISIGMDCSSPDSSDDEKTKVAKETTTKPNTRRRVARVKTVAKARVKTERNGKVPAKKKPVFGVNSSMSDTEPLPETPDDYLPEFRMENIKSVPRISVAELEQNTVDFSKYVYSVAAVPDKTGTSTSDASKSKPENAKNAIAKDKLEKKIAAGSMNENYVRLNLRKKVFVRGKKTINFSRYKKKLWKSKKATALSGPDMDMGGCDGGILTCFQCGLPGHFAQNCKAKSEVLILINLLN